MHNCEYFYPYFESTRTKKSFENIVRQFKTFSAFEQTQRRSLLRNPANKTGAREWCRGIPGAEGP